MYRVLLKNLQLLARVNKAYIVICPAVILSISIFYSIIFADVEIPDKPAPVIEKQVEDIAVPETQAQDKPAVKSEAEVTLPKKVTPRKPSVSDKLIGSTFKTLAKTFVATVDIEKLKKNNIEKLNKKDEAKFRKQYVKIYKVVKDCPSLAKRYGLSENLTKEQAIEKINSLKKKDMYTALDLMPDTVIADQFRQYLQEKKQEIQHSNVAGQIKQLWDKMTAGAFGKKDSKK